VNLIDESAVTTIMLYHILITGLQLLQPFPPVISPSASAIAGWMSNPNQSLPHAAVSQGPHGLVQPPNGGDFFVNTYVFVM